MNKKTKIIVIIAIVSLSFCYCMYNLYKVLEIAADLISKNGLKSVVDQVWNGQQR